VVVLKTILVDYIVINTHDWVLSFQRYELLSTGAGMGGTHE
jgi:hypothetical protein